MTRLKREQLVSAALDLVDEEGGAALTMRSLAERAFHLGLEALMHGLRARHAALPQP